MGYRIRVVPEVEVWLEQLRDIDPGAAHLVDEALDTLREAGAGLGPPLVVPVEILAQETRPDLDFSYQRQLEMLTRARRRVADVATARKRLELQITQLEVQITRLADQRGKALEAGDRHLADSAEARRSLLAGRLADFRNEYASLRDEEERLTVASQQLQFKVDDFRLRKEAIKAADTVAEAVAVVEEATAAINDAIARAGEPDPHVTVEDDGSIGSPAVKPGRLASPPLSELRPGAPESADIRILFTVDHADTADHVHTALLLAAGTERDWLQAWYAEMLLRCRIRYERMRGSTG
jgi:hypothetical protein